MDRRSTGGPRSIEAVSVGTGYPNKRRSRLDHRKLLTPAHAISEAEPARRYVLRQLTKQDMNALAENTAQLLYFEQLEDTLHTLATKFARQKKSEGDAMSEFAYELAQLGFSFVLANSVSDDFEEDIENINYYIQTTDHLLNRTAITNFLRLTLSLFYP
jgi:hypothetical protein